MTDVTIHLTCLDVILGIHNPNGYVVFDAYNYCILLAKQFIYKQKKDKKACDFYYFQIMLKDRLEVESLRSMINGKVHSFERRWRDIFDSL